METNSLKAQKPIQLKTPRVCGKCQKMHFRIPQGAELMLTDDALGGAYWDCDCKSTLFQPMNQMGEVYEN